MSHRGCPALVMVTPRPQAQTVHGHHPIPAIIPILAMAMPGSPQHHPLGCTMDMATTLSWPWSYHAHNHGHHPILCWPQPWHGLQPHFTWALAMPQPWSPSHSDEGHSIATTSSCAGHSCSMAIVIKSSWLWPHHHHSHHPTPATGTILPWPWPLPPSFLSTCSLGQHHMWP